MPGVSTREAIQKNHSRMVDPNATTGKIEGNPVRADIDSVREFVPVAFIVNVVLDEHKMIRHCVAGDVIEAHRAGCKLLDKMYSLPVPHKADIVIVSAGGFPKDMNLYQAQKALDNAGKAVRDGGSIVWIASGVEGLGEKHFEEWMLNHQNMNTQDFMNELGKMVAYSVERSYFRELIFLKEKDGQPLDIKSIFIDHKGLSPIQIEHCNNIIMTVGCECVR